MHSLLQERACVKIAIAIKLTFWEIEGKLSGVLLKFSSQVAQLFLNFTDSLWTLFFYAADIEAPILFLFKQSKC